MVFHWRLSDNKSSQGSRTFLSILVDHNIDVVWMFFIHPHISIPFNPCINTLVTVPSALISTSTTVNFRFLWVFFNFGGKVEDLINSLPLL